MFKTFANNELLTAADVNNYLMRQAVIRVENQAVRDGLPAPDLGMLIYREDLGEYQTLTAAGWAGLAPDTGWVDPAAYGTGWAATSASGGHKPRLRKMGKRVEMFGAVTGAAGATVTNVLTVPVGFRPVDDMFIGSTVVSSGAGYAEWYMGSNGVLTLPSGYGAPTLSGRVFPLVSSWWID